MKFNAEIVDRFRGAILGLAVGDAMGVPLGFTDPDSFQLVNDMTAEYPSIWTGE
jgi:ADP-ribosylglycohydrolase